MRSDTVLDYAVFELSPKHSRCELFVTSNEETEKLASGLIEPFVNHLRVLESQSSPIRLEVEKTNTWFTKRTLERFVQFVNSPESLEKVNTYYAEMSQLEAARTLYSQRSDDSKSGASDDGAAADATKKELLRAIDLRLEAIKKDLTTSIAHASASGFDPHTVSELQQFADRFGARHLDEACSKYISLWKKRPDLIDVKSSNRLAGEKDGTRQKEIAVKEPEHQIQQSASTSSKRNEEEKSDESVDVTSSTVRTIQHTRRLSVQDRINLFESKQKENSNSGGSKPVVVTKSAELKRLSSDLAFSEKPVLRRISVVSDASIDLASEKKFESSTEGSSSTPSSVPSTIALKESCESIKKGDEIKYELKSNSVKACNDEVSQERVESSKTATEKSLVSGFEATSDAQSRSVTDSNDSSASQNQTDSYVDKLRNAMSGAISKQREEANDINTNNVSQSSVIFPSRHTRSRSVHMEAGIQEDLTSQPQFRSSVSRIKKKEVVASDEQPQKQQFNIRDCIDDGEGKQVRANNNRFPTGSMDQVQRTRLSKENTGANDELKLKANELEKLFAEHKLRVPGDQSSSSRRGKASETQVAQPESSPSIGTAEKRLYPGSGSGDLSKLITPLVGDKDKGDALRRNFSDLSCLTDDSKGKFYDKYMKKRDAKLREEWSLKKGEKETKLKSMQEALEQSRTEMKAKLSASSSERRDSLSSTRQRAEKFRSFNSRSSMKKYQHPINSFQSEEDEDCSDQKPRGGKDKQASGQQSIASRSSQARKVQPNRNMPSSITPRSAASVPKPSGKVSNTSSGRRRSDKSLAQSVPNFSDLIKENTKSSSLAVKTTMRSQVRSSGRIKNTTKEDIPLQRPRSLRKSSTGNIDFTELSALCSDDMMASLNSDKSENMKNEEYDEPEAEAEAEEVLEDYVRGEEEEEAVEELETSVFKDENPTLSDVYEKVDNSGEENCNFLPTTLPSRLLTASSLMDSPGESPLSWNANLQHAFSYPHEHLSDIDASADSPMGSPASWSSRMRKKWGAAQSPVTAAAASNLSQLQSKKDLTKGFKRLLKFGRKSRGAESLMMDWVSVTTSEGDDEFEDRRDLADRSSDDLRKSRMGSLQSHLSEDGCNESEFTEQASSFSIPEMKEDHSNIKAQKSFFSLSTFRGKGNDSKPR